MVCAETGKSVAESGKGIALKSGKPALELPKREKCISEANQPFYRQPVLNAAGQGHFIGIFQFAAKGNATADGRDLYTGICQFLLYVVNGGIALNVGVECKNHFGNTPCLYTADECFYLQLIGANAIERRNNATQHMVSAVVLLRTLNSHHIANAFYHAYQFLLAHGAGANVADVAVAHIVALPAKPDLPAHLADGIGKQFHLRLLGFEQMQHQAQGRFFANAR